MALIGLQDVSLGFGGPRLFDGINLQIEQGERVGLLGRNGAGGLAGEQSARRSQFFPFREVFDAYCAQPMA